MAKRLGFRQSHQDTLREMNRANAGQEAMFGDLRNAKGIEPLEQLALKVKRGGGDPRNATDIDRVHRKQPIPLEAEVLRAICELLAAHPKVLIAVRQNTGAASYEAKTGRYAPVHFYKLIKRPVEMTLPDIWGLLKDGRYFACEVKREDFTKPRNEREFRQAAFLSAVRNCGGIGIFATSADQVADALA